MVRPRGSHDQLNPRGRFHVEHWRGGKKIGDYDSLNTVTNEGKNALLDPQFNGLMAIGTWYIALVDGSDACAGGDGHLRPHQQRQWLEWNARSIPTVPPCVGPASRASR